MATCSHGPRPQSTLLWLPLLLCSGEPARGARCPGIGPFHGLACEWRIHHHGERKSVHYTATVAELYERSGPTRPVPRTFWSEPCASGVTS